MSERSRYRDRRYGRDYDYSCDDRDHDNHRRSPNSPHCSQYDHESSSRRHHRQLDHKHLDHRQSDLRQSDLRHSDHRGRDRSPRRDYRDRRSYQDLDDPYGHDDCYGGDYLDDVSDYYGANSRSQRPEEVPNKTVMLRGLSDSVLEADIVVKLNEHHLVPKDIRLMRNKDTGLSRGFAFVEFNHLEEAVRWKDETQGCLYFEDCRASIHYSVPKEALAGLNSQKFDWTCYKCGVSNFKRREECFKCGTDREESEANHTGDEISPTPTNCLVFRNLSPRISEPQVLSFLGSLSNVPIKSIRIPKQEKNENYGCPRGVCYVELHTTTEATQLLAIISSVDTSSLLDPSSLLDSSSLLDPGNRLIINYGKRNGASSMTSASASNAASVALAAAQWTNSTPSDADLNSKTSDAVQSSVLPVSSFSSFPSFSTFSTVVVNGVTYQKFPTPDPSKFVLDSTSGFFYDHSTTLYFDPKSTYYYNGLNQQYLYWSQEHETYLPVPSTGQQTTEAGDQTEKERNDQTKKERNDQTEKERNDQTKKERNDQTKKERNDQTKKPMKGGEEKPDKVKTAKKIAKDMEKWAKSLNQKSASLPPAILHSSVQSIPSIDSPILHSSVQSTHSPILHSSVQSTHSPILHSSVQSIPSTDSTVTHFDPSQHRPIVVSSVKSSLLTDSSSSSKFVGKEGEKRVEERMTEEKKTDREEEAEPLSEDAPTAITVMKKDAPTATIAMKALIQSEEVKLIDTEKLLCLLCKRQFSSLDQLGKHQSMSQLHKTNLDSLIKSSKINRTNLDPLDRNNRTNLDPLDRGKKMNLDPLDRSRKMNLDPLDRSNLSKEEVEMVDSIPGKYVDRAAERRKKWTGGEEVESSKERERYLRKVAESESCSSVKVVGTRIDEGNKGNRMLKAMGWKEGQGLGKNQQGRSDIIDVTARKEGSGLGMTSSPYLPKPPGESYKDAVKRTMAQRYKELSD